MHRAVMLLCVVSPLLAACAEEFEPRRESINGYTVVWLAGSPYEMGFQHGELLQQELQEGLAEIESNVLLKMMKVLAESLGLGKIALDNSYPEIIEECNGLRDGFGDPGWTMDHCMLLNFGDALVEFVRGGMPEAEEIAPGCTQFVANGPASADGRLVHARILDWSKIDYLVKYPVIFVKRPADGVPHAMIGFPGNLSPYQGINAEGIAVASNEVSPKDNTVNDRTGRSHVQLLGQILGKARSLAEARAMVLATNHMTRELFVLSDGKTGEAEIHEMSPAHVEILKLADGLLFAANHFQGATTAPLGRVPPPSGSSARLKRLEQLLGRGAAGSLHGKVTPSAAVQVMRDRTNGETGEESPADTFDDGESIATNGALYGVVFDPAALTFWVAAGKLPVLPQPFVGFSLGELLGEGGAAPATIP